MSKPLKRELLEHCIKFGSSLPAIREETTILDPDYVKDINPTVISPRFLILREITVQVVIDNLKVYDIVVRVDGMRKNGILPPPDSIPQIVTLLEKGISLRKEDNFKRVEFGANLFFQINSDRDIPFTEHAIEIAGTVCGALGVKLKRKYNRTGRRSGVDECVSWLAYRSQSRVYGVWCGKDLIPEDKYYDMITDKFSE